MDSTVAFVSHTHDSEFRALRYNSVRRTRKHTPIETRRNMVAGPGKRRKTVNSTDKMATTPGAVVWARVRYYPWWPAVVVPADYSLFTETVNADGGPNAVCVLFFADCRLSFLHPDDIKEFVTNPQLQNKEGKWADKIEAAASAAKKWLANGAKVMQPSNARITTGKAAVPIAPANGSNAKNGNAPDVVLVSSGFVGRNTKKSVGSSQGVARTKSELEAARCENARLKVLLSSVAGAAQGLAVLANDFNCGIQPTLEMGHVSKLNRGESE